MAIVRLNSQCHLATDFAGCRMLSWTPKFVSNRRFRGITPCTVVVCMLLLLSPEAPVAFRWPFHHPAHPQWTNSGVPQFLFASAAEQTQTPEHGTESETDGVDTQAQSEQPPAIRRRTRSLGSSLRQRSVAAKRMMLARFFLAAIPIIALGYGCYKFFEEEGETAGDEDGRMVPDAEEEESGNQEDTRPETVEVPVKTMDKKKVAVATGVVLAIAIVTATLMLKQEKEAFVQEEKLEDIFSSADVSGEDSELSLYKVVLGASAAALLARLFSTRHRRARNANVNMNQSQREMPRDLQHAPDAAPRPAPTVAPEPGSVEASQAIASVSLLPAPRDDEEQEAARAAKAVCEDLLLPEGQSIKELLQMVPLQIPDDSKTQTNLQRLARRLRPQRPPREGNLPVLLTPNMNEAMASVMDEHLVNVSYVSAYSQNHFEKVVETGPLRRFAEACENGAETAEEQAAHEFWSKIVKLYTIRSIARSEHHQFAEVVGTKWLDENKALYESFYTRVSVNTMELQRLFFLNYIETAKRIGWECLDTQGKPMPADVPEAYLNHLEKHIKVRRAILKATLWRLAGRQNELTLDEKQTADRIISDQDLTQTPGGTPLSPFEARMFTAGWTPRKG